MAYSLIQFEQGPFENHNRPTTPAAIQSRENAKKSLGKHLEKTHQAALAEDKDFQPAARQTAQYWRQHTVLASEIHKAAYRLEKQWLGGKDTRLKLTALANRIDAHMSAGEPLTAESLTNYVREYRHIAGLHQHRLLFSFRKNNVTATLDHANQLADVIRDAYTEEKYRPAADQHTETYKAVFEKAGYQFPTTAPTPASSRASTPIANSPPPLCGSPNPGVTQTAAPLSAPQQPARDAAI